MIKHITYAVTALSLAAGPAAALSCPRTDAVAAYNAVAEAEQSFVILRGAFSFDKSNIPDLNGPPAEVRVASTFKGKLLTKDGFTDDVEAAVTINLACAGPWCARMSPDTDYLAYVLQTEAALIFNVDPCYSFAFSKPDDDAITAVEQCAKGGDCKVEQPGE